TLAVAVLFFWFHFSGGEVWSSMRMQEPEPHALRVEVTGAQFQWYFRYPGADGIFGTARQSLPRAKRVARALAFACWTRPRHRKNETRRKEQQPPASIPVPAASCPRSSWIYFSATLAK